MLSFASIKGHDNAIKLLQKAILSQRISHAYLFVGPEGVGKEKVAYTFAAALNCLRRQGFEPCRQCISCQKIAAGNHPDFMVIDPQGKSIKIQQLRQLQRNLMYKHYEGHYRIILIREADAMTGEAANSFLKILEEPPLGTVFILLTTQVHRLPPTVVSRCQQVKFNPVPEKEIAEMLIKEGIPSVTARIAARLSEGRVSRAFRFAEEISTKRKEAIDYAQKILRADTVELFSIVSRLEQEENLQEMLELIALWFRDVMVWQESGEEKLVINNDQLEALKQVASSTTAARIGLEEVQRAQKLLRMNVNLRLVLENLVFGLRRLAVK
ncbi:DNA polymerase III subunit delta' [Calderihabitans maritimus]|uniref:DNA polymerase III subunit delta' n=1 Tax=Calderihabitans maritimus TaxID=1246530 RepID=A0A1Z5HQM8_9FIRM|nr:DNA polymerase III subunit delta' [Calderihabitans maritimus]GAW91615.1 DNA polymerase III, delta prime subunit [Calderihabitans maritimus]